MISKIFYVANQIRMCPFLMVEGAIDPWIQFFKTILDRPVPSEFDSFDENMETIAKRDKSIHWKIKGIAAKCTYRLFSKYGKTTVCEKADKPFVQIFLSKFAEPLLESHLGLMFRRKTHFVGSKCLNFVIKYVTYASKVDKTMEVLKPFIENILYETVIPLMLVTHKDVTLFDEDPIEYIRKQTDFVETLYMPKNTILDLLQMICLYKSSKKKGSKPDYLFPFLNYTATNMT